MCNLASKSSLFHEDGALLGYSRGGVLGPSALMRDVRRNPPFRRVGRGWVGGLGGSKQAPILMGAEV